MGGESVYDKYNQILSNTYELIDSQNSSLNLKKATSFTSSLYYIVVLWDLLEKKKNSTEENNLG